MHRNQKCDQKIFQKDICEIYCEISLIVRNFPCNTDFIQKIQSKYLRLQNQQHAYIHIQLW